MIEGVDRERAPAGERHGPRSSEDALPDIPTGDVDMAAQLALDRGAFATAASAPVPAEAIAADGSPVRRTGLRNGLMLALRFVQARILSVWGLLFAAALCPPKVFADFAIFSALANFVSIAVLLRFEAVFFQNNDRVRLGRAFRLALAVGTVFLAGMTAAILLAASAGWLLRGFGALFLISLASRAAIRLITAEATAEGDFATIGNSNVVQAIVQPAMMILLIWPLGPTALALFAADAFGHAVAASYLFWRRRKALIGFVRLRCWSQGELVESAIRWRTAPTYLLPSALLSFGFMVAPLLALPFAGNALLAAHVALAMRLLEMPMQLFNAAVTPLAMNDLRKREGADRQRWARRITMGMVTIVVVLFAGVAIAALGADYVLEGTQWEGVGEIMALLSLFYGCSTLVGPLHEIGSLSLHPRRQMMTNAVALAGAVLVVWWFGTLSLALLTAIGCVSFARMLAHIQFAWTRMGTPPVLPRAAR